MTVRYEKIVDDPANFWLKASVPGWLLNGNIEAFEYCARLLTSSAPAIEIGSHFGLSTSFLTRILRNHGRANRLFSADAWAYREYFPSGILYDHITPDRYRAFVVEAYKRNMEMFLPEDKPAHLEMQSDEFFASWDRANAVTTIFGERVVPGGPISFAYIDGSHEYEQCRRDFLNTDRHLEIGGFIVFDDSSKEIAETSHPGSRRVALEAAALSRYEVVFENPNISLKRIA